MPLLTLTFPPGTVATISKSGNTWTVDDVNVDPVVIVLDDIDGNGTISNAEWDLAVGGDGNDVGDGGFLFEGGGISGLLYSTDGVTTFTVGENVSAIRNNLGNTFEADVSGVSGVVCFGGDTLIATPLGPKPVSELGAGDEVVTSKGDTHPIRWIGGRFVSMFEMLHAPKLRPIRIRAGALGNQLPERDLLVSRQHRILVNSKIAARMFGSDEVLVPAIKLVGLPGIDVDDRITSITYFHILLDAHEILLAEGAPAESLFTGPEALKALDEDAVDEIKTLFPQLLETMPDCIPAALLPSGPKVNRMIERHKKNNKALLGS